QGVGMGWPMCRSSIEAQHGRLWLVATRPPSAPRCASSSPCPTSDRLTGECAMAEPTVFVVDDPGVRKLLLALLDAAGFQAVAYGSAGARWNRGRGRWWV